MTGVLGAIVGGWEYVWAAYGVGFGILAVYVGSLVMRMKRAKAEDES